MSKYLPLSVLAILALAGCGESPQPEPVSQPTQREPSPDHGRSLYMQVCAQCHGMDARGHRFLGADLKASPFFNQTPEDDVLAMIKMGKPATTDRPAMPPKGGRMNLSDEDIRDIIAYIKTLPGPEPEPAGSP